MLTRWHQRKEKNEKGFTLVELIIVMAILAILAGIAVPKFGGILSDSKTKADQANKSLITNAIDLYYANKQVVPGGGADADAIPTLVTDGYLKEAPKNPSGTAYVAKVSTPDANGKYTITITP